MKKTLIAATLLGSLVMAGCSSSDSSRTNDIDPDFGLVDPEFGIPAAPVQPPINDDNMTPDRLPPTWGGVDGTVDPDFGLPTDQTPDRPSPDFGEDMPTWGGECGSPDGGANCGALPPKPGVDVPDRRDSIRSRLSK